MLATKAVRWPQHLAREDQRPVEPARLAGRSGGVAASGS
jgi:hypothetical protein